MGKTLKSTIEILKRYNIRADKRFGQNFLVDDEILEKIVECSDITKEDFVIEIGPGLGNLTEYMIDKAGHVLLIEIDNKMIDILETRFKDKDNYTLFNEDILKINIDEAIESIEDKIGKKYTNIKVVANLPYYITTPILFKLLQESNLVKNITVMVQKEVAQRMVAKPKNKDYGILTIMVDYLSSAKMEFLVPPTSFIPSPDVTSAIVKLEKCKKYNVANEKLFFELIHKAFAQRRKKLINSLVANKFNDMSKEKIDSILKKCGVSELARAEELPIQDYIILVDEIEKTKI